MISTFHLSLPCLEIEKTKVFYINILGATSGRRRDNWLDINLFGSQITFIKSGNYDFSFKNYKLDGNILPSFHFGVILSNSDWKKLYQKLKSLTPFYLDETKYLLNKKGEHISFFVTDPNGFIVEFKSFKEDNSIFTK